jgi:hypothetical protein
MDKALRGIRSSRRWTVPLPIPHRTRFPGSAGAPAHGLYWPYTNLDSVAEYCYSLESAGTMLWKLRSAVRVNALQRFLGIACLYELLPSSRLVRSYDIHSLGFGHFALSRSHPQWIARWFWKPRAAA